MGGTQAAVLAQYAIKISHGKTPLISELGGIHSFCRMIYGHLEIIF